MKQQYYLAAILLAGLAGLISLAIYSVAAQRFGPEREAAARVIREAELQEKQLHGMEKQLVEQRATVASYQKYQDAWEARTRGFETAQQITNRMRDIAENALPLQIVKLGLAKPIEQGERTLDVIEAEVSGTFPDLMSWVSQIEGGVDFLRHHESRWRPQSQGKLSLQISFVIDFAVLQPQKAKADKAKSGAEKGKAAPAPGKGVAPKVEKTVNPVGAPKVATTANKGGKKP